MICERFRFFAAGSECRGTHLLRCLSLSTGERPLFSSANDLFFLPRSASTSLATSWSERGLQVKAAEGLATSFLGKSGERKRKAEREEQKAKTKEEERTVRQNKKGEDQTELVPGRIDSLNRVRFIGNSLCSLA